MAMDQDNNVKKKKVVVVALQKRGGGALDGVNFSNALAKEGFFHCVVVPETGDYAAKWDSLRRERIVSRVPTYGAGKGSFIFWTVTLVRPVRLAWRVLREHPDVVHAVNFHPWLIFVFMARPFGGYKVLYTFQDNPFDPKEDPQPGMNSLERRFVHLADALAPTSAFTEGDIKKFTGTKRMVVLPLGVYEDLCPGTPREKHFHEKGPLNVLFFGRIEGYKGLRLLVEAADKLAGDGLKLDVVIAGRGTVEEASARIIKERGFTLKNYWISDEEICSLFAEADVVVAPYERATQSGIVSLALAYRVPVIATNVGALPEYVHDGVNGFLVKVSAAEIAAKLKVLHEDRTLLTHMSEGARRIAEKFSWAATARKAIGFYNTLS